MQKYKEKHGFTHCFLHKSRVLVGRGGFEPKRETWNPFILKGFSHYSPFVRQFF